MEQINDLEGLANYFHGLADGSIEPIDKLYGICYQIDLLIENDGISYEFLEKHDRELHIDKYYYNWEYWSGESYYPVPSTDQDFITAGDMFDSIIDDEGDMWTGSYGDLRKDLCRHIAKEIEKLIPVE